MATKNYQLFFVIGLTMQRPYNSLELWPSAVEKGISTGEEFPIHTMNARQIYKYEA